VSVPQPPPLVLGPVLAGKIKSASRELVLAIYRATLDLSGGGPEGRSGRLRRRALEVDNALSRACDSANEVERIRLWDDSEDILREIEHELDPVDQSGSSTAAFIRGRLARLRRLMNPRSAASLAATVPPTPAAAIRVVSAPDPAQSPANQGDGRPSPGSPSSRQTSIHCRNCDGDNMRKSSRRSWMERGLLSFFYLVPLRCRSCNTRFRAFVPYPRDPELSGAHGRAGFALGLSFRALVLLLIAYLLAQLYTL